MNLLFDTHTFLWWNDTSQALPARVLAACQDTRNNLYLSVVSVWEIQIKQQIGKLHLQTPIVKIIEEQSKVNRLRILPIRLEHALAIDQLPLLHRDPFDRLLMAQTITENLTLLSGDHLLQQYGVRILWN